MNPSGFLDPPPVTTEAQRLFDDDMAELGFVMNASRLWAYQPATGEALFGLMRQAIAGARLSFRERGILVAASASAMHDSYCSLAWGSKLAAASDAATASGVLRGADDRLTARERAMARWARKVAGAPNDTGAADVQELRDAGFGDDEIFAITVFVALRRGFATVNEALGTPPDAAYRTYAPPDVLDAVTYGRPIADTVRS